MNAPELLELLTSRGARVEAHGDRLTIDAPRGALNDFAGDIARFKPALLELLGARVHSEPDADGYEIPTGPNADFRAWHWRACDAPFRFGFYNSWEQFARVHCGNATAPDVATVARAVLAARHVQTQAMPSTGFDMERVRVPWRVASHMAARDFDSPSLLAWALSILESENTP